MFEEHKKKRLSMTQGLARPRILSAEKRRALQASLEDFKRDLGKPHSSNPSSSNLNMQQTIAKTPTMKDLSPMVKLKQEEQSRVESQSPRFAVNQQEFRKPQMSQAEQKMIHIVSNYSFELQSAIQPSLKQPSFEPQVNHTIAREPNEGHTLHLPPESQTIEVSGVDQKSQQQGNIQIKDRETPTNSVKVAERDLEADVLKNEEEEKHKQLVNYQLPHQQISHNTNEKAEQKAEQKVEQKIKQINEGALGKEVKDEQSKDEELMNLERSDDSFSYRLNEQDGRQQSINYSITEASVDGPQRQDLESSTKGRLDIEKLGRTYSPKNSETLSRFSSEVKHAVQPVQAGMKHELDKIKESEQFQPTYDKLEADPALNFNYNTSHYGSSSNNSSAIFFTSQFKQYLNREKLPEQNEFIPAVQQNKETIELGSSVSKNSEARSSQRQGEAQSSQQKGNRDVLLSESFLKKEDEVSVEADTPRGKESLAYSRNNDSEVNFKFSKASVEAQNIVSKKLDEELVLEISHFSRSQIVDIFIKRHCLHVESNIGHITRVLRVAGNCKRQQRALKKTGFDSLMLNQELGHFNQTKHELMAKKFREQSEAKILKLCFGLWRGDLQKTEDKVKTALDRSRTRLKRGIFKVLRMLWYDGRVKKQADLYYLSKIFVKLRETTRIERKRSDHLALRQYCYQLKKIHFGKLYEGSCLLKRERQMTDAAREHYRVGLIRKCLEGWVCASSREPQFISLTMSSKDAFRETVDHRWLQTRTVDFKEMK